MVLGLSFTILPHSPQPVSLPDGATCPTGPQKGATRTEKMEEGKVSYPFDDRRNKPAERLQCGCISSGIIFNPRT